MAKQILVALKSQDRLAHVLTYLDKVAQTGMRVVLLVPYDEASGALPMSQDSSDAPGPADSSRYAWKVILEQYSSEGERRQMAERKVYLAQEALRRRGVEIGVNVYEGSLRDVVRNYLRKGEVQLVLTQRGLAAKISQALRRSMAFFGLLKQPVDRPAVLFCPQAGA